MLYRIQCMANEKVHSVVTGHFLFAADSHGYYITEDKELADRAAVKYPVDAIDASFSDSEPLIKDLEPVNDDPIDEDTVEVDVEVTEEDEVRAKAKELGIKSWHLKSIENLVKEITELEGE